MPTRRNFVAGTLATGTGALLAAQGPHKAAAQADRRQIVDAQVHLWKAESPDWKWVPGLQPQLPEPFTIERLVPMMDEAGVDRAVNVPPSWPGDRNDYALEAVKATPPASASWAASRCRTRSPPICSRNGRSSREWREFA
jgi:hypothetical protein